MPSNSRWRIRIWNTAGWLKSGTSSGLNCVSSPSEAGTLLEHLFRHQAGRMTAHLTRLLGSAQIDLAEEIVQEAMLRALQSWPYQGVPENPQAWLFRTARNAAMDVLRHESMAERKQSSIKAQMDWDPGPLDDEL